MLRTILIDDEIDSLQSLEIELNRYCPEVTIIQLCEGGKRGVKAILEHKPELVFLDIEMPVMNGFELLEQVRHIPFEVIFTTAYDEYAIRAFKVSALDYLLKPIDITDLKHAVQKVIDKTESAQSRQKIDVLLTNIQKPAASFEKLAIPTLTGLNFVNVPDIVYCEADSNYTTVHTLPGEKFVICKTLKQTEELLNNPTFFRTHQTYLVNLNLIKEYVKGSGGYLIMKDDTMIQVARARKEALMQLIYRK